LKRFSQVVGFDDAPFDASHRGDVLVGRRGLFGAPGSRPERRTRFSSALRFTAASAGIAYEVRPRRTWRTEAPLTSQDCQALNWREV
jgi:hypothetical protein